MKRDLPRPLRPIITFTALGLFVLLSVSCSRQSSRDRHLKRADQYFASEKYVPAEIEYKNVLQIDSLNPQAIARLGIIYFDQGSVGKAIPFLLKAHELQPDNLEIRLKLGQIALERGEAKEARDEAAFILERNPKDRDAPFLLVDAAVKPKEIEDARARLKQLPLKPEDSASVLIALEILDFRQHNTSGAEASIRKALALDPNSSAANFALGTLFWMKKDTVHADQAFEAAAKVAPLHSPTRLKHAQFKGQIGDLDGARRILEGVIHDTPDYIPAVIMLVQLDMGQKKLPEATSLIDKVLQRDGENPEARILGARIELMEGETDKAIADLGRLQAKYPKFATAYYALGQAYLAGGDGAKAINSLNKAVAINPNFTEAVLLLAGTNIRKGDFKVASESLEQLVQKRPDIIQARMLLAEAYRDQGNFDEAIALYGQLEKSLPKDPQMVLLYGQTLLQMDRRDEARESFSKALEISPGYLPAIEQLINVDLMEKKYPEALQRANAEIDKSPSTELPRLFLAKIYLAQDDRVHAEAALSKAIELKPDAPTAYFLLAQLYEATNRKDKALADLKEVVTKNPKALGALMMMGIIYDSQENYTAARDSYEKILAVNPRFSSALNNLAYLYSEKFDQLDKGFDMAQRARELLPNEPHTADTLGWILYKKRQYPWALGLLQESANELPSEADVQFHLGMARYMMGDEGPARIALQQAIQLKARFDGSDEAKQRLSILAINASTVADADRPAMEKSLAERTDDPVARARLAVLYERDGALDKAADEFQVALKLSPANVGMMLNLVRLYDSQHQTQKAMDLAKDVHKLAPNDPEVSHALGNLAYRTGDYQWAYSLLQEAVRAKPEDPNVQYDMANAAFSVGKLPEAEESMRHSIQAGISGTQADEARKFLDMTALLDNPAQAALESPSIEKVLKLDPGFAPALMALAGAEEARHDTNAAMKDYEKVLGEFPDFPPAQRRMAILYSEDPGKDQKTLDLAIKARETYPDDAELEKALGIVDYRMKDFERAVGLLQDCAQKRSGDAELLYYLGMSRFQLKDAAASRKALQQALDLGLGTDYSAEARRAMATMK